MADPIWRILKHRSQSLDWLARRTRYQHATVRAIACGARNATAEFRARCADVLDMPEDLLFDTSDAPQEVAVPG